MQQEQGKKILWCLQITRAQSHSIKLKYFQELATALGDTCEMRIALIVPFATAMDFHVSGIEGQLKGWSTDDLYIFCLRRTGQEVIPLLRQNLSVNFCNSSEIDRLHISATASTAWKEALEKKQYFMCTADMVKVGIKGKTKGLPVGLAKYSLRFACPLSD
eukprot:TRINITY_DN13510_c0_g1_i1.p1 TRINITY_DN13510_c0_g1~~TRINITY_DN13510_c0_g1_i1.p1  ORF type:complete len:161 (-),score=23.15 TRINITY_DN13510_c0_g1_i1:269-751(-)